MNQELVKVFHGGVESLVRALDSGGDLYYALDPKLPTACFSTDIRHSIIFASEFTREREFVTEWLIPLTLLSEIDKATDGSTWYSPSLLVDSIADLPIEYLRRYLAQGLNKRRYPTRRHLEVAFEKGEVVFTRTPNQYYKGHEEVDSILARFRQANDK